MFPFAVRKERMRDADAYHMTVPCGQCPECMKRRVSVWSFRLRKEEEVSVSSFFVTLTYDTENVPISANGFMTLHKPDVQKFFKRLRKKMPKNAPKISYYVAGEYGSKRGRPHYHAIIFNASEKSIQDSWLAGSVDIGFVSGASVAYTLKYINKGRVVPAHAKDDRIPEFALMSKGLGKSYLTPATVKHHKRDLKKAYIVVDDGVRIPIPRYYKDKIYTEDERKRQNDYLSKIMVEKPKNMTDKEIFEARKNALQIFRKYYKSNRKDF